MMWWDRDQLPVATEAQFFTTPGLIDAVANERRLYAGSMSMLLAPGLRPLERYDLGCTICGHLLGEHDHGIPVTSNGCRCCARTETVPVRLVKVKIDRETIAFYER